MISKIPFLSFLVLAEISLYLWARFEAWRLHYETALYAWLAIHWRLTSWLFKIAGAVLVRLARWAREALAESQHVARATEATMSCYRRLHGYLEYWLVIGLARLGRHFPYLRRRTGPDPLSCHSPLPLLRPGPGEPSAHLDSAQSTTGGPVSSWHGRVISIVLGLAAGLIVAGVVWLFGLYRLPGATLHSVTRVGRVPLLLGFIVAAGLVMGVAAHYGSDNGGSIDDGFANRRHIRRSVSAAAVRKSAAISRPGFAAKTAPVRHSGALLGRYKGRSIWAALKDIVLVIAPPQTGKTAYLGGRIIDAPGAVVATSTKADVHYYTAALRARVGPVWVLNPEGLGGVVSNFRWDPLVGCDDPDIASERAGYLLSGIETGSGDDKFWHDMNLKLLRCLLMAAALGERTIRDVLSWVNDSTDTTALRIMQDDDRAPREWVSELNQIRYDTPERTRQSVHLTLARSMQFVTLPAVATAVCPAPDEPVFSLDRFLRDGGTLYLLGSDRPHASIAPLFTAITGYIFEGAKREAGRSFHGRLRKPLSLLLDEVKLICPVPLPSMTADCGGRGIQLMAAVQSPSQLYERWGERGGQTIINNSNAKLVFGGLGHAKDLDDLSRLCGQRDDRVRQTSTSTGGHRSASVHVRQVPVLAPHEVRQIPDGQALLLYRNIPPMIVKTERVWDRKDVKAVLAARRQRPVVVTRPKAIPAIPKAVEAPAEVLTAGNIVAFPGPRTEDDQDEETARAEGEN